ncbi:MAG: hypothetical protein V1926_05570 [Candidatus Peregrinibacteria bacterium]
MASLIADLLGKLAEDELQCSARIAEAERQLTTAEDKRYRRQREAIMTRARTRIAEILTQRKKLEHMLSGEDQIERFGREKFEREFFRLSAVGDRCAQARAWRSVPDCLWKRVFETYCREFLLPRDRSRDHDGLGAASCLLSPDLMNADVLSKLGLPIATEGERLTAFERLRRYHAAIPAFKDTLDTTRRLEEGNNRMWIVASGGRKGQENDEPKGPRPEAVGKLLVFSQNVSHETGSPVHSQRMQVFDSLLRLLPKNTSGTGSVRP